MQDLLNDPSLPLFKFIIVGDSGVGKTSLLLQYINNTFSHSFVTTIGIDYKKKTVDVNGNLINLQIWDTAGNERFRTITASYFRGSHGMLLVYDVTDRKSFEDCEMWIETVQDHTSELPSMLLVGNKADLESFRCVSKREGVLLAKKLGIPFVETSAAMNINVEKSFLKLSSSCVERALSGGFTSTSVDVNQLKLSTYCNKKRCCLS